MSHGSGRLAGGQEAHVVQFYPADGELAGSVSRYLAEGISSGDGVVVVATEPHRDAFVAGLAAAGIKVDEAERDGRLLLVDAAGLLGTFLDGDRLDGGRFAAAASGLLGRARSAGGLPGEEVTDGADGAAVAAGADGLACGGRRIRIYAEMVALLWEAGQVSLAIELEELWNGLAARFPFSLQCGYPASVLDAPEHVDAVADVRRLHGAAADARSFPCELGSVRAARHYVAGLLDPVTDQVLADGVAIAVTELAANAVLHGRSAFTVIVSRWATRIRIAVRDNAPLARASVTLAPVAPAAGESVKPVPFPVTTGHGLSVVARLASRWGVEPTPAGKVVWAELGAC
ncbi:sensor histidine kinase [Trebonia kvetii]|uniref:Sensor histidine kinase n=1 Tax=Trebonia kvetii TaxID=2480626 RepID=A0A6P2BPY2_9ACTN|nr:MEDS domain-containing protein [Trebonia kvetii]TVZ00717.1 sensor histidine kinase [Trebonia kvetii]